jgi:Na+-driven multidrug efflux pump
VLCILYYIHTKRVEILRLGRKWLVFDNSLLKKTISYGWVSAMQQATVQLGKIGIQAIVNTMGVSVAAAFAVVNRIDDFAYTPEQNIGHAMTALMAQNKGANEKKRMKEGFKCGMVLEFIYGIILFAVCFILARPLMLLFVKDEEVILHGVKYLRLISFMYILPAATNGIQGYFRGIAVVSAIFASDDCAEATRKLYKKTRKLFNYNKNIIFDMDGTLADSMPRIYHHL